MQTAVHLNKLKYGVDLHGILAELGCGFEAHSLVFLLKDALAPLI